MYKEAHFFFTVTLADRSSDLLIEEIARLRKVYRIVQERRPFETIAICVLPDHIHTIWVLPDNDTDFAVRWSLIKSGFSRGLEAHPRSPSKVRKREKGICSADTGSMQFATKSTSPDTSITSTSIL